MTTRLAAHASSMTHGEHMTTTERQHLLKHFHRMTLISI